MKRGTLSELSRLTGFSKSTISRILSGKADKYRVSESTQRLVMSIYKLINEDLSGPAQHLRNDSDRTIGLAVPSISNPFFANLSSYIIEEARKYNYSVTIYDTQENGNIELEALYDMRRRKVDGIIIVPCGGRTQELEELQKHIPIILVDRYFKKSELPYISTNNFEGGYLAMKELIRNGHRNILCIEGPSISVTTKERERGCKAAIKKLGQDCNVYFRGNEFSINNGYLQTRLLNLFNPRPSAIFSMSSTILLGAMQALRDLGVNIAEDISIISFDDLKFLDYFNPPISRIAQPLKGIGQTAVKILVGSIDNGREINSQILMSPTLINGKSVRKLTNP